MPTDIQAIAVTVMVVLSRLNWIEAPLRLPLTMLGMEVHDQNIFLTLLFTAGLVLCLVVLKTRMRFVVAIPLFILQLHVAGEALAHFLANSPLIRHGGAAVEHAGAAVPQAGACTLARALSAPLQLQDGRIGVDAIAQGRRLRLALQPADAVSILPLSGSRTLDLGGTILTAAAASEAAGAPQAGFDGSIGADILANYDVELDLQAGQITLWQAKNCQNVAAGDAQAYPLPGWAQGGRQVTFLANAAHQVLLPLQVNDAELTVMLDGGAAVLLSTDAARRAGWDGAPGGLRMGDLTLGGARLPAASVGVSAAGPVAGGEDGTLGLLRLGAQHVMLSYSGERLYLVP